VPPRRKPWTGSGRIQGNLSGSAGGNPEPSRRYTDGRCRDYLRATVPLMTGQSVPRPHSASCGRRDSPRRAEIPGSRESLGSRFESWWAHFPGFSVCVCVRESIKWPLASQGYQMPFERKGRASGHGAEARRGLSSGRWRLVRHPALTRRLSARRWSQHRPIIHGNHGRELHWLPSDCRNRLLAMATVGRFC